jgi:hypothetical protein
MLLVGAGFTICPATNKALNYTYSDRMYRLDRQFFENLSKPPLLDAFIFAAA